MPVTRIPIDGLLRCLCPAIDGLKTSPRLRPMNSQQKLQACFRRIRNSRARQFNNSAQSRYNGGERWNSISPHPRENLVRTVTTPPLPLVRAVKLHEPQPTSELAGLPLEKPFPKFASVHDVPITHLHERLRQIVSEEGTYQRITDLVEYLIKERGEKPALVHYDALVRSNADAENGSAEVVERLLKEMKEEGVGPDSGLYHGALQTLAIHPDYILRSQVMQEMKERWLGLSPDGWHNLVVGLLRDRQFEAAMDKLEQMQSDEIHVQPWLYDIFLYQLCEVGELDEAFRMLCYRFDHKRTEISPSMWYYLLDSFSSKFHYAGTKFVWKARIQTSNLVPSDGICLSTLNLAAREGDPGLAISVIRILSARRSALSQLHYEALLAAYVKAQDVKTSFWILTIMAKAGLEPDSNTTRPLFLYLTENDMLPDRAWQVVKSLHKGGHVVPIAAVNVIIEAKFNRGRGDLQQTMEIYKELHTICESGPNIETFNILLQGTARQSNKAIAMFFASEMRALGVKPDRLTYDRFILVCTQDDDYEDAFRYLEEMQTVGADKEDNGQKGWWMRDGTMSTLIQRCVKADDPRAWELLEEARKRGLEISRVRKWVQMNWNGPIPDTQESSEKIHRWTSV